jgi:hypothetical protein
MPLPPGQMKLDNMRLLLSTSLFVILATARSGDS